MTRHFDRAGNRLPVVAGILCDKQRLRRGCRAECDLPAVCIGRTSATARIAQIELPHVAQQIAGVSVIHIAIPIDIDQGWGRQRVGGGNGSGIC